MDAFEGLTGVSDVDLGVDFGERTHHHLDVCRRRHRGWCDQRRLSPQRGPPSIKPEATPQAGKTSMPEADDFFSSVKRADLVDC